MKLELHGIKTVTNHLSNPINDTFNTNISRYHISHPILTPLLGIFGVPYPSWKCHHSLTLKTMKLILI